MSEKLNEYREFEDESSWDSLFKMAEYYEEESDVHEIKEVNFYEEQAGTAVKFQTAEEALKQLFGYDSFRDGQKDIIDHILAKQDSFAVMPTGAGKSLCYQIPAMLLPGVTIVISPLISLMQDQVKALNEAGVSAAFINSALSESAYYKTVENVKRGLYKIIYVAPERLMTEGFIQIAKMVQISMVTVDEAHCISQWGQDFRPSYMKIVEFIRILNQRPIISAFTATATETVREDIVCTLGLNHPFTLVTGFNRENLFFQVEKPKDKNQYILNYINAHKDESGIIYCATRKNVDSLYELLAEKDISVAKYHAGMSTESRKKMQDDFVYDYKSIIVATNAFGMGIDKSNVRYVIHYNMPQSMENYYQEAGRAGRDGLDSKCILLFSPQDIMINRFLLDHKVMADLDPMDRETVKERDRQRLQSMERYCYTTECLRNYILKYFGENPSKPCEDCGNCLREFETLDMTEEAKKLINCVFEAKGRYGKTIIIDIVSGAKTARLKEIDAFKYKSYGVLASSNKKLLHRLFEQLILEGYLVVGDYQVIKMGNISALKNPDTKVLVRITDEDKLPMKESKSKKKAEGMQALTSVGFKLFEKLRELRLEIAREEHMPPYIIFNDKTLIDMAIKVPTNQDEMLNVSGVGDHKYLKYGERFQTVIDEFIKNYPEVIQEKEKLETENNVVVSGKVKKSGKQEFYLTKKEAENFEYHEYMNISAIRDEMNRICDRNKVKRIAATRLSEILTTEGLIEEVNRDGIFKKVATEKGLKHKISSMDKMSERGTAYTVLAYPEEIQRMLVEIYIDENVVEEEQEEDNSKDDYDYLNEIRKEHADVYGSWSLEEDQKLVNEFNSDEFSIKELSEIHGRTTEAIRARLKKLDLIK